MQTSFSVKTFTEIWVSYTDRDGRKLQSYDGTTWLDHTTDPGVPASPRLVSVGSGNDVFVASADTVVKYNGTAWTTVGTIDSGQAMSIKTSGSGELYLGVMYTDSLNVIKHYNGSEWESFSLGYGIKKEALSMAIADDGTIYAGTLEGLYRVKNGVAERFVTDEISLPVPGVSKLIVD